MQQHIPSFANVFCSDAHFHLCVGVNKQNLRYWAEIIPQKLHELPLHSPKVTVWCAISELEICGALFLLRKMATQSQTTPTDIARC